ncbi:hypothetical protein MD484_g7084, partial [Candolleomyces efflorescens]
MDASEMERVAAERRYMQRHYNDLVLYIPEMRNVLRINWPCDDAGVKYTPTALVELLRGWRLVWTCFCGPNARGRPPLAKFVVSRTKGDVSAECCDKQSGCGFKVDLTKIHETTAIVQVYHHFRKLQTGDHFGIGMDMCVELNEDTGILHGWLGCYDKIRVNRIEYT